MTKSFGAVLGSVLLAMGVASPALGRVNESAPNLVFFGLTLLAFTVFRDMYNDIDR